MDDFSRDFLIGLIHPESKTNVTGELVAIKKYAQIGNNAVVFPNLTIGEGSVIDACSMLKDDAGSWSIHAGILADKKKNISNEPLSFPWIITKENEFQ